MGTQHELVSRRNELTQAFSELQQVKTDLEKQPKKDEGVALRRAKAEVGVKKEKVGKLEDKLLTSVMKRKMARWNETNNDLQKRKVRNNLHSM